MKSRSSKARGRPESNSNTPYTSSPRIRGITTTDAIPKARQLSRFTRGSFSASSHCRIWRVRTLSPDSPESICRCAPSSGADAPELAQQTMVSPWRSAMAAPDAPVMYWARSASNCSVASRSRCAISLSDLPPSSPGKRSVSRTGGKAEALSAETGSKRDEVRRGSFRPCLGGTIVQDGVRIHAKILERTLFGVSLPQFVVSRRNPQVLVPMGVQRHRPESSLA